VNLVGCPVQLLGSQCTNGESYCCETDKVSFPFPFYFLKVGVRGDGDVDGGRGNE